MKKIILLLLIFPLILASCSDDDDDNKGGNGITTMVLTGKATSYDTIELSWSKVSGAYGYIVCYKVLGASQWEVDAVMAKANDNAIINYKKNDFDNGIEYVFQIKAIKGSLDGDIIAESNQIQVETPTEAQTLIVGKWQLGKARIGELETNDTSLTDFIRNYYDNLFVCVPPAVADYTEFKADGTFIVVYEPIDARYETLGTYTIVDDQLTMTYEPKNGESIQEVETVKLEVSAYNLEKIRNLEKSDFLIEAYNKEVGVVKPNLEISKFSMVYPYVRLID